MTRRQLKDICFKKIWSSKLSQKTRDSIWKYLQSFCLINININTLEKLNDDNLTGVFHCFTGSEEEAKKIISLGGFYLGIGGVITFKNAGLDETIKNINLEYLVLETDSPYLAPTPFRGKGNESQYIINIAEKLAETHKKSIKEIARITTKNAKNLFQLSVGLSVKRLEVAEHF